MFRSSRAPRLVISQLRSYRLYSTANAEAYLEQAVGEKGITTLTLNRPAAKNAISINLLKELRESLDKVAFDPSVNVLIIRSSQPGSFCAGADLVERRSMTKPQVNKFLADLRAAFSLLEDLPMPTIAAIDGPALGGGLEMALSCDLRVAGASVTKIGLPEAKLGIIPGAGGTQRATRLLGSSKAKTLIFTGRMLTAQHALRWGVVDMVSEENESAYDSALNLAKEINQSAPLALRAAKLAISRAPELDLDSGLSFERACYEPLLSTSDRIEALDAFREKRKPLFKGE
ncbi:hypothetical protein FRB96_003788 [Tulasnella sp. 330]|nr:hypothetical protein FRB96_003788 [Tulasnella sp. 330]KAG8883445.1 hypothetical protein FRB97_006573 [Tulasnella sp. 331]KAG8888400.1 hypothetical protein FRB98_007695 [Tulasnella sp. 332]